jgi:hypothetical protein
LPCGEGKLQEANWCSQKRPDDESQVLSAIRIQGLSITMQYDEVLLQETVMMTSF